VASVPSFAEKRKASLDFGDNPVWSGDGKALFYRSGDDLCEAEIRAGPGIEIGERRLLLFKHRSGAAKRFAVDAGGQRILLMDPVRQIKQSDARHQPARIVEEALRQRGIIHS
jgi:hypothetical protein